MLDYGDFLYEYTFIRKHPHIFNLKSVVCAISSDQKHLGAFLAHEIEKKWLDEKIN